MIFEFICNEKVVQKVWDGQRIPGQGDIISFTDHDNKEEGRYEVQDIEYRYFYPDKNYGRYEKVLIICKEKNKTDPNNNIQKTQIENGLKFNSNPILIPYGGGFIQSKEPSHSVKINEDGYGYF